MSFLALAEIDQNIPNINPLVKTAKVPYQKAMANLQANQAIYLEVVKQLELAKVTHRNKTPLIQIIDKPSFPLENNRWKFLNILILGVLCTLKILDSWFCPTRCWTCNKKFEQFRPKLKKGYAQPINSFIAADGTIYLANPLQRTISVYDTDMKYITEFGAEDNNRPIDMAIKNNKMPIKRRKTCGTNARAEIWINCDILGIVIYLFIFREESLMPPHQLSIQIHSQQFCADSSQVSSLP